MEVFEVFGKGTQVLCTQSMVYEQMTPYASEQGRPEERKNGCLYSMGIRTGCPLAQSKGSSCF